MRDVPLNSLLNSESYVSLSGQYLYARNLPNVPSPKHGLYKITYKGLLPYFESSLSTPQLPVNLKRLFLFTSSTPSYVLLYN
jgi:hypothetical protein